MQTTGQTSDFQETQGKMEHPRLVSVAEELVPNLLKPKRKPGGKIFSKLQELKAIEKSEETNQPVEQGKIDNVGRSHLVNQPKQTQIVKETDSFKPRKGANIGNKQKTAEIDKTTTASSIAKTKTKTKTKGE